MSDFSDMHLVPAFTARRLPTDWPWEVVSSYSSATAPDSHGISCANPLIKTCKELLLEIAACPLKIKGYLSAGDSKIDRSKTCFLVALVHGVGLPSSVGN